VIPPTMCPSAECDGQVEIGGRDEAAIMGAHVLILKMPEREGE